MISFKGAADLVTETDKRSEEAIIKVTECCSAHTTILHRRRTVPGVANGCNFTGVECRSGGGNMPLTGEAVMTRLLTICGLF